MGEVSTSDQGHGQVLRAVKDAITKGAHNLENNTPVFRISIAMGLGH